MTKDLDRARAARLKEKRAQAASDAALDLPVLEDMATTAKAMEAQLASLTEASRTIINDQTPRGPLEKYAETVQAAVKGYGTLLSNMASAARQQVEKAEADKAAD